ncbi:uncharacterized protein B0H18DRAFT_1118278 [Fomitopsis serialis]|uniref:uncharacterized protein n=1 Tax=Fomitopsis serialis TaxID=139415 RepID=UPI0020073BD2|nr:uncharacterized protein B0H18DRAFT_1118278 [Neoantrodia serialis]KAH9927750.1 hypothetical protein B0H18DRAFT_1118278 [Neoantrodia serialis]
MTGHPTWWTDHFRCLICHSVAHPTGLCPMPAVRDWHGPTPNSENIRRQMNAIANVQAQAGHAAEAEAGEAQAAAAVDAGKDAVEVAEAAEEELPQQAIEPHLHPGTLAQTVGGRRHPST